MNAGNYTSLEHYHWSVDDHYWFKNTRSKVKVKISLINRNIVFYQKVTNGANVFQHNAHEDTDEKMNPIGFSSLEQRSRFQ